MPCNWGGALSGEREPIRAKGELHVWRDDDKRVFEVAAVRLTTSDQPWAFALEAGEAIDAHWMARKQEKPSFFNGA